MVYKILYLGICLILCSCSCRKNVISKLEKPPFFDATITESLKVQEISKKNAAHSKKVKVKNKNDRSDKKNAK